MEITEILSSHRLAPIMRAASDVEKFLLLTVLRGARESEVTEILDALNPSGPDYSAIVVGKPLHHWIGKNREQITRELQNVNLDDVNTDAEDVDDAVTEIFAAIEDRTGSNPDDADKPEAPGAVFDRRDPRLTAPAGGSKDEPTFGEDQIPASELFDKSDDELLAMDGIGAKTLEKIRALQAERDEAAKA